VPDSPVPDSTVPDSTAAAQADDAFGANLYQRLAAGTAGNLIFSPVSISAALQLALMGARGETAAQLAAAMQLAGPDDAADGLRLLSAGLARLGGGDVTCRAPNTMWLQAGFALRPEFTSALAGLAGAVVRDPVVRETDFAGAPQRARLEINAAIAEQTAGKIADLLGPAAVDRLTRLVLASAVYLKAAWAQPFPAAATAGAPFYPDPGGPGSGDAAPSGPGAGGPVEVPMMQGTASLGYLRGAGYQAVTVPYAGGLLAMAVVVPDGPLGPLEETLAGGGVRGLLAGVTPQRVRLALPRFRVTAGFSLVPVLKSLGVTAAFDLKQADFTGLSPERPLAIAAVAHKAFIDVDEHGTEAAAATAVGIARPTAVRQERPPIVVTADRPFLFAISDAAAGWPLFLGRVTNPLAP
jgi:serpin B